MQTTLTTAEPVPPVPVRPEHCVLAFGFPLKFHTNLCGHWYSQVTLSEATRFLSAEDAHYAAFKHNLRHYQVESLAGRLPARPA